MDIRMFVKELNDYELCLRKGQAYGLGGGVGPVEFWIENISDPSVGMFSTMLTPRFNTIDGLYAHWCVNKPDILKDMGWSED